MASKYGHEHRSTHFGDNFSSLDQLVTALAEAGLESSNLILGIDFTKSNECSGKYSFRRRSLHDISDSLNPYEQAISVMGRKLSYFDDDGLIPCFGFGDASTCDQSVFSFYSDHRYCHGFEEALARYREIVPHLKLSGPTSFAPIIDAAIDIVARSNGQYHVLVIVSDGQVTRRPDLPPGRFSPQEQATVNSIVAACQYPLSIILVGVGDGPWDAMKQFDDNIPQRAFDNFQFVNFTKIMSENTDPSKKETAFALAALMEIPFQYRATQCISRVKDPVTGPRTSPLPPPPEVTGHTSLDKSIPDSSPQTQETASAEPVRPNCLTNPKNMGFGCLNQLVTALAEAGLESSNLILGIDFTKSNECSGKYSFRRRSLHDISDSLNPYEQAISVMGRTLSYFDDDGLIPCFGFGDASTCDQSVFSFYSDHRYCHGFEEALARYREIVPHLKLSGPTSFAPIIDAAIDIVARSNGQYHVLVIVSDGQVTRRPDLPPGRFSPQEQATVNSIVAACQYPLSIILVGVGDGPWDAMKQFDDNIPQRAFDNFQFVNFTKIMSENTDLPKKETAFALAALMEIPFQYRATQSILHVKEDWELQLDAVTGPRTIPLPPPLEVTDHISLDKSIPDSSPQTQETASAEPVCPICLTNPKNMAFGCGHMTCKDRGASLPICPLCRQPITTCLRLYT